MAVYRDVTQYPPTPKGTRRSSEIRAAWGPVPRRSDIGLTDFVFWDGTTIPGGVEPRMVSSLRALDDVFAAHNYRLDGYAAGDDWGYANRNTKHGDVPSLHSWPVAYDINATENPYSRRFRTTMPPVLIRDVLELSHGGRPVWTWGGLWGRNPKYRFDTMHFQTNLTPGEAAAFGQTAAVTAQPPSPDDLKPERDSIADRVSVLEQRVALLGDIVGNNRSAEDLVASLYRKHLNRVPDELGMRWWVDQLNAGVPFEDLAVDFEAAATHGEILHRKAT